MALAATVLSGSVAHASVNVEVQSDSGAAAGANARTTSYGAGETLADAIELTNANGGGTITFASSLSGTTIDLADELPWITEPTTIVGPGANELTIHGDGSTQLLNVFTADGGATTLSGLTFTGGVGTGTSDYNTICANTPLTLEDVTVSGGSGSGAALFTTADTTIADSTFSGNGNSAATGGGAITGTASVDIESSTFEGNSGPDGGVLFLNGSGIGSLVGVTAVGNSGSVTGGLDDKSTQPVHLDDSILADNAPSDAALTVAGPYASINAEFSLIGDTADSGITTNDTDLTGIAPDLGPLQNNGGQTDTMAPLPDSPVVATGNAYDFLSTVPGFTFNVDQRGESRVGTGADSVFTGTDFTDMGAVEVPPTTPGLLPQLPPPPTLTAISAPSGSPGAAITITGSNFAHVESVTFGATATSFRVRSATTITANVPADKAGSKVDVRVTTLSGESAVTAADKFVLYKANTKTAKDDNQKITFTSAADVVPLARSGTVAATFKTTKIKHKAPALTFKRVVYSLSASKKTWTYRRASSTKELPLSSLKAGHHTLKATVYYTRGSRSTTKTLSMTIDVA